MNLRYVIRNGERVLQTGRVEPVSEWKTMDPPHDYLQAHVTLRHEIVWQDIPLCNEETGEPLEEK